MATILDTHSASMLYLKSISDILTKTVFLQLFLLLFILKSHDMVKIEIIFEIVGGRGFFKQPPPPPSRYVNCLKYSDRVKLTHFHDRITRFQQKID